MGCTLGGVVAVRAEEAACSPVVAGDDVALDACDVELVGLLDLGNDAAQDSGSDRSPQIFVIRSFIEAEVLPPLETVVHDADSLALLLLHKSRLLAAHAARRA